MIITIKVSFDVRRTILKSQVSDTSQKITLPIERSGTIIVMRMIIIDLIDIRRVRSQGNWRKFSKKLA